MASTISYGGPNSGFQAGVINGNVTAQFAQSETSLNQACLRDLRTTNPHDDKDRIKNMNGGLLKDSYCWILDNEEYRHWQNDQSSRLLWIKGDPGKGKTMLLCGVIEELTRSIGVTANISFFFCQATDLRINNATAVLRGLIYSLVEQQPSLLHHVRRRYDPAGKALFEDINAWNALSSIFTDILKDVDLRSTYLMIDALDECTTDLSLLLSLIAQEPHAHPKVKWIVSSRNSPDIEERLGTATQAAAISLELNGASISEAVNKLIWHKVNHLATAKQYKDETRDTICRYLSSNAQDTFLWVALVCQELDRTPRRHALKKLEAFPPRLNALYSRMFDQVLNSEDSELCKRILAVMSIVHRPLALDELASLIELPDDLYKDNEDLSEIIAICGSFLTLTQRTIIFVHQSAKEFLLREARNTVFPEGKEAGHYAIFSRSLQGMHRTLRRDVFGIKFPGFPIEKVTQPSPNLLAAIQYACVYWVDHLQHGWCHKQDDVILDEGGCVDLFLRQKYLNWLEALSILGSISQGIVAMLKLEDLLQKHNKPLALSHRVRDASRFIRYWRVAIESSPLQIYTSSLIFSPTQSITRKCYESEKPDWILNKPSAEENWNLCLHTLEGHDGWVRTTSWSQDGSRLVSASNDNTVRIWDPATGQCKSTLAGHSGSISSVDWSQDGSQFASASFDKTVRIWDSAAGQCALTLEGHTSGVRMIDWSQDGSRLASASDDKTVRIWDPVTGQCVGALKGHYDSVYSVSWSQNGCQLASGSSDHTIRIWDPEIGRSIFTLEGHSSPVTSVIWSQNGSRVASASDDKTVRIWDSATGRCKSTLEGHNGSINSIAWSNHENRLMTGSSDHTVRIWDPATGNCLFVLEGHSDMVMSLALSKDGTRFASASWDRTVRIWDSATGQCTSILEGHTATVNSIAWSQDGSKIASASWDKTVRIWDSTASKSASTHLSKSVSVLSIAWPQDGSRLASGSSDSIVRIWDPATGQCVLLLKGHSGPVSSVAWSPDGSRLASVSDDKTVRIWDLATKQCLSALEGHGDKIMSIAWSNDRSRLATASWDKTIRIWDPISGQCLSTLKGHNNPVWSIDWSQDGCLLASASLDMTVKIWDPAIDQCKFTLRGHGGSVCSIAWSQDGSRLASASSDRILKIWDTTSAIDHLTP
ncbi:hypothetical protein PENARI_c128G09761 [Penicillium arizonense]|uniref:NACHT domain-containing protein n=1 Tax=Penicillium arizonense TaxID=1835702 RepID=A0A1F5L155_PENAI|nr:hypothetical protein PENARI_c128G09761 [Penicillium arizonense]OGE46720.1 hypothetical protein PENARI_c128G09761 [Penicillium arizonense]